VWRFSDPCTHSKLVLRIQECIPEYLHFWRAFPPWENWVFQRFFYQLPVIWRLNRGAFKMNQDKPGRFRHRIVMLLVGIVVLLVLAICSPGRYLKIWFFRKSSRMYRLLCKRGRIVLDNELRADIDIINILAQ